MLALSHTFPNLDCIENPKTEMWSLLVFAGNRTFEKVAIFVKFTRQKKSVLCFWNQKYRREKERVISFLLDWRWRIGLADGCLLSSQPRGQGNGVDLLGSYSWKVNEFQWDCRMHELTNRGVSYEWFAKLLGVFVDTSEIGFRHHSNWSVLRAA